MPTDRDTVLGSATFGVVHPDFGHFTIGEGGDYESVAAFLADLPRKLDRRVSATCLHEPSQKE